MDTTETPTHRIIRQMFQAQNSPENAFARSLQVSHFGPAIAPPGANIRMVASLGGPFVDAYQHPVTGAVTGAHVTHVQGNRSYQMAIPNDGSVR